MAVERLSLADLMSATHVLVTWPNGSERVLTHAAYLAMDDDDLNDTLAHPLTESEALALLVAGAARGAA